ncbi:WD repeat-containing protein 25 isoform 1-T2 [Pholidichthys leucotaenia]
MSSLVAYEDSDSEDESLDQSKEGPLKYNKTVICGQNEKDEAFKNLQATPSPGCVALDWKMMGSYKDFSERYNSSLNLHIQPKSSTDCEPKQYSGPLVEHSRASLSSPVAQGNIGPMQAFPCLPQRSGNEPNPAKRQKPSPVGIRPYVPKRQRLATSVEMGVLNNSVEQVQENQSREHQILSDVSARLKPYLGPKLNAAGLPRRLLMSLGGHQGPVNMMQWCPVPHLSHLLLSASMDKTFKVWDAVESGRCLRAYTCHSEAVRDACWTPCGRRLLTGSFDDTSVITDVETGQQMVKVDNQFKLMCVVPHPSNPDIFLCGGYSSVVKAWDSRSCKVVKMYKAGIQQTLDILFLRNGADFITSSDCVSRDSADRTLIAWDFQTTAKVSNQIYHERYTCPSLALHPLEESFVAQTNGNYMAVFSSQQPYRMNKRRRFEGHKVEGYAVRCNFSQDGTVLASGSSTGSAHFYDYNKAHPLHTLHAHNQPCLCVSQHPVLPTTVATCDWAGEIKVWH